MKHIIFFISLSFILNSCKTKINESDKVKEAVSKYFEFRKDLPKYEILMLGVFHTDYPNLDLLKSTPEDQIDILSPQRQKEVEEIINELAIFKPTKIFVELDISQQSVLDSLYSGYLEGKYRDNKTELFQIGMRLAKKLGHKKIFASDSYSVSYTVPKSDSIYVYDKFKNRKIPEVDKILESSKSYFTWFEKAKKNMTLTEIFQTYAQTQYQDENMVASYFDEDNKPYGSDQFPTGWYNRNIRIYTNIKRHMSPNDKVLVMYGGSHVPVLKQLFRNSYQCKVSQFGIDPIN